MEDSGVDADQRTFGAGLSATEFRALARPPAPLTGPPKVIQTSPSITMTDSVGQNHAIKRLRDSRGRGTLATMQLHEPHRNAVVFAALGDPTRLGLLGRLGRDERSLSSLAAGAGMSRQAIAKHLDVLERAGLVHGERRGREHRYRATPAPLGHASAWLDTYRQQWEAAFDRLDAYLQTIHPEPTK